MFMLQHAIRFLLATTYHHPYLKTTVYLKLTAYLKTGRVPQTDRVPQNWPFTSNRRFERNKTRLDRLATQRTCLLRPQARGR